MLKYCRGAGGEGSYVRLGRRRVRSKVEDMSVDQELSRRGIDAAVRVNIAIYGPSIMCASVSSGGLTRVFILVF